MLTKGQINFLKDFNIASSGYIDNRVKQEVYSMFQLWNLTYDEVNELVLDIQEVYEEFYELLDSKKAYATMRTRKAQVLAAIRTFKRLNFNN